jgi:hypothetical protein
MAKFDRNRRSLNGPDELPPPSILKELEAANQKGAMAITNTFGWRGLALGITLILSSFVVIVAIIVSALWAVGIL